MVERSLKYMDPESTLTLREALTEYYELNPSLLRLEDLPDDAAEMFRCHDVGHVVFGCDTSLRGETLIDTWTIFGSTSGLRGYAEYFKYPQVNAIFAEAGFTSIAVEFLRCLPDVIRVAYRGLRLERKWPWKEHESFLEVPLNEIRHDFNIAPI
ncbi:MAG: hypothetical protein O7G84_15605 [Gammaproteobacteria bacterium]|nr:hypothetical protein [Gammaproteobacteria bacterium]